MTANSFSRTLEMKTIASTYFQHTLFQRKTHYILTCSYQTLQTADNRTGGTHWRGVAEWQTDKCLNFSLNVRIPSQVMDSASLLHHSPAGGLGSSATANHQAGEVQRFSLKMLSWSSCTQPTLLGAGKQCRTNVAGRNGKPRDPNITSHYLLKNCATLWLHTLGNDSLCV